MHAVEKGATLADEQVVFRDYPIWIWFTGLMTVSVSVGVLEKMLELLLFVGAGVAIIGFASVLTITVDTQRATLQLRYWSPLRVSTKTYRLSEISFVNVVEDNEGERMYRLELMLWSGEVIPLRSSYSIGKARKERRAQRIRSLLEVGGYSSQI